MSDATPVMFRNDHGCKRFQNKNVIVTAGTQGIGLAIAYRLCSEGANVFICSRKQKNVDESVAALRKEYGKDKAGGIAVNVAKDAELEKFVMEAVAYFKQPRIDCVVSNVGVNPAAQMILDSSPEFYDKIMNTNVRSHWLLLKYAKPYLKRGASILLVSSTGAFHPESPLGIYGMSKTALVGLGKALAGELGGEGIRINTICPGVVRTKMAEFFWKDETLSKELSNRVFLKRHGDPVDMAGPSAFLLSEDAKHITGESVIISGGTLHKL